MDGYQAQEALFVIDDGEVEERAAPNLLQFALGMFDRPIPQGGQGRDLHQVADAARGIVQHARQLRDVGGIHARHERLALLEIKGAQQSGRRGKIRVSEQARAEIVFEIG